MKLTLTAKTEALGVILRKAFAPKFDKMLEVATAEFVSYLHNVHPHFFKALADPNISPYMSWGFGCRLKVPQEHGEGSVDMVQPVYGSVSYLPDSNRYYHTKHDQVRIMISQDIQRPTALIEFHPTLPKDYFSTWNDYIAAQKTLSVLFNSYTTVEKLIADFPEYSIYFPKDTPIKKNLPMVQVGEIRGSLSALGIPGE